MLPEPIEGQSQHHACIVHTTILISVCGSPLMWQSTNVINIVLATALLEFYINFVTTFAASQPCDLIFLCSEP